MSTSLLVLYLTGVLAQAPASGTSVEATWLKSVPTDAEVIVRVRGVDAVRDDLLAMIRAMSPTLGDQVEASINQAVEQMADSLNQQAVETPILALFRAQAPEQGGAPPFAVMVQAEDYPGVLSALNNGQAPELKKVDGIDSFTGPQGDTVYAMQGSGFVAFGTDSGLIGGIAKPPGQTLADTLPTELTDRLLGGDLGIYVNMAVVTTRYADQINAAKEQIIAAMTQAGEQMGNDMMKSVGEMYAGLFDMIKVADGFALNFDFDKAALDIAGDVTLKAGSEDAARLAASEAGSAESLAKMPADAAYYVYLNVDPSTFARFQQMGMSMMFAGGQPSAEMQKVLELQKELGRTESISASSITNGMRALTVMRSKDPKKLVEMTVASQKAMGDVKTAGMEFIEKVDVTPEAESYQGYSFTRSTVTFNLDAFAKAQPNNPMAAEMMKGMFGGDSMTTWTGTDGTNVISVAAPSWDAAKAQIDAYTTGGRGIGSAPGYEAVRRRLPEKVNAMFLISAQGLVQQIASQFSAMFGAKLEPPGDMPKEPALMGFALAANKRGYQFQMVVPSPVGPVIERGLIPLFLGLQGQVNQ